MKILITSGGTRVPIDDVRYIGNMSTGRYGAEIAARFLENIKTDTVHFLYAKDSKHPLNSFQSTNDWGFEDIDLKDIVYNDYYDYLDKSVALAEKIKPSMIISAAAVSDYVVTKTTGKISSSEDELVIKLTKASKVLPLLKKASPNSLLIGFKLLVSPKYNEVYDAVKKVFDNGADYVVYNDLTEIRKGDNSRLIFKKDMTFTKVESSKDLTDYLINENFTRIHR